MFRPIHRRLRARSIRQGPTPRFYLCVFQGFAPSADFEKIRDRLVGIILGLLVSSAIFRFVWPERAGDLLRPVLGRMLRNLAKLVLVPSATMSREAVLEEAAALRGEIAGGLDEARRLLELTSSETATTDRLGGLTAGRLSGMVRHGQALLVICTALTTSAELDEWDGLEPSARDEEVAARDDAAARLCEASERLASGPSRAWPDAGVEPARPPRPVAAQTGSRRDHLVGRLLEQTRLLIAPSQIAGY